MATTVATVKTQALQLVASAAARALPNAPQSLINAVMAKPSPLPQLLPKVTVSSPATTVPQPQIGGSIKIGGLLAASGSNALQQTTSLKQQANSAPPIPGASNDVSENQKAGLLERLTSNPLHLAAAVIVAWYILGRK